MKPHKHAELIKAWADGAEIQLKDVDGEWFDADSKEFFWTETGEYRIKPEPKPDVVWLYVATSNGFLYQKLKTDWSNLKLTFDGETGELKSAEVLK